jgi:hypothetical protein
VAGAATVTSAVSDDARKRREAAAARHRPSEVDLLLVAEAPPSALDRYFYFEDVREHDSLFRYVARMITGEEPSRSNKADLLTQLRHSGVFLIDLKQEPVDGSPLASEVDGLIDRIHDLHPRAIVLIKSSVYDAAFHRLQQAGLPVIDERVPFPGSGQQRRFEETFARALQKSRPPR